MIIDAHDAQLVGNSDAESAGGDNRADRDLVAYGNYSGGARATIAAEPTMMPMIGNRSVRICASVAFAMW